jgi:hypothetical protein
MDLSIYTEHRFGCIQVDGGGINDHVANFNLILSIAPKQALNIPLVDQSAKEFAKEFAPYFLQCNKKDVLKKCSTYSRTPKLGIVVEVTAHDASTRVRIGIRSRYFVRFDNRRKSSVYLHHLFTRTRNAVSYSERRYPNEGQSESFWRGRFTFRAQYGNIGELHLHAWLTQKIVDAFNNGEMRKYLKEVHGLELPTSVNMGV